MRTYKTVGLTALICIITTSTFWYVFGAQPTNEFWITSGPYPSEPSYVVWIIGTTYYVKDQQGKLVFETSNFTAAFEYARDGLSSGGGLIWLKEGDFVTYSILELKTSATRDIVLAGTIGSKIKAGNNANLDAVIEIRGSHKGNVIKGITIDGNSINNGADRGIWIVSDSAAPCTWVDIIEINFEYCPIGIDTITFTGGFQAEHYLISKCKFGLNGKNSDIGIFLNRTRATRIEGCIIEDCQDIGIKGDTSNNIVITNCHFDDCINYAIYLDSCGGWAINNCFFEDTVNYDHVYIDAQSADNTFTGNTMHSDIPGRDCFHVLGQRNVFVGNSFFSNPNGAFIYVLGDKCLIVGNNFQGSADYGIRIDGADYLTITGNYVGICTYGILEETGSDYNLITSCTVRDSVTGDIITVGANTKVNLCWNGTGSWIA